MKVKHRPLFVFKHVYVLAYFSPVLCFLSSDSSDMESKTDASLTSEELAAIEDEEVLNKMVSLECLF